MILSNKELKANLFYFYRGIIFLALALYESIFAFTEKNLCKEIKF